MPDEARKEIALVSPPEMANSDAAHGILWGVLNSLLLTANMFLFTEAAHIKQIWMG